MIQTNVLIVCACISFSVVVFGEQEHYAFTLGLDQRYGRATYTDCRLTVFAFQGDARVRLNCTINAGPSKAVEATRPLSPQEIDQLKALANKADLCGGGHTGHDFTPLDGMFETLTAGCRNRRLAILVTTGNPTFETDPARSRLIKRLHDLRQELEKLFYPIAK